MEEQDRKIEYGESSIRIKVPEYTAIITYKKRRFVVPEEFRFASKTPEPALEERTVEQEEGKIPIEAEESAAITDSLQKGEQIKLF